MVREALLEHGIACELLVIRDGETAIRYIQSLDMDTSYCPDLIIVDLNLPRRSGLDVLTSLRHSEKCSHAAVAVLSSSSESEDVSSAIRLGANQYLTKPLHVDAFLGLGAVFKSMLEQPPQATTGSE